MPFTSISNELVSHDSSLVWLPVRSSLYLIGYLQEEKEKETVSKYNVGRSIFYFQALAEVDHCPYEIKNDPLGWRCGSNDRLPAAQLQSPEFKPHPAPRKKNENDTLLLIIMVEIYLDVL